jgi:hypothetical protein
MKNKKRTFFIALAIILTAGIYYFYSQRNKTKGQGETGSLGSSLDGKLYQYEWIGCNSCPSENLTPDILELQNRGFAGIHIGSGFTASGKVSIGDKVQIVTNSGSDVEGTYNVIGIGAGCEQGASGYPNLIVVDLAWNCSSNANPTSSNGGVLRIIRG